MGGRGFMVRCPECGKEFSLLLGVNFTVEAQECEVCGLHVRVVIECPHCRYEQVYAQP